MLLLAWIACGTERGPRPDTGGEDVALRGYVYAGPLTSTSPLLADATIAFTAGDVVGEATQPYADYPGYWSMDLPAGAPYELLISAPDAWPTRWAGTAPGAGGSWFAGAVFGGDAAQVVSFLTSLGSPGVAALDPADADVVHVIGSPWDADAWDCANVRVGGEKPTCFLQDPATGSVSVVESGPFSWFVQLGLPAGPVTVDSGLGGVHTYPSSGGELVYAFWFQGAPS